MYVRNALSVSLSHLKSDRWVCVCAVHNRTALLYIYSQWHGPAYKELRHALCVRVLFSLLRYISLCIDDIAHDYWHAISFYFYFGYFTCDTHKSFWHRTERKITTSTHTPFVDIVYTGEPIVACSLSSRTQPNAFRHLTCDGLSAGVPRKKKRGSSNNYNNKDQSQLIIKLERGRERAEKSAQPAMGQSYVIVAAAAAAIVIVHHLTPYVHTYFVHDACQKKCDQTNSMNIHESTRKVAAGRTEAMFCLFILPALLFSLLPSLFSHFFPPNILTDCLLVECHYEISFDFDM